MLKFKSIPEILLKELKKIIPSRDSNLFYYPVKVYLKDNKTLDRVYLVEQNAYIKTWGVYPDEDKGKKEVKIENITKIEESPSRLPVKFANQLYEAGESGMGYCFFTLIFKDGQEKAYLSGNAVDFINYPKGKGPNDIIEVIPHKGRDMKYEQTPPYFWCIYSEIL